MLGKPRILKIAEFGETPKSSLYTVPALLLCNMLSSITWISSPSGFIPGAIFWILIWELSITRVIVKISCRNSYLFQSYLKFLICQDFQSCWMSVWKHRPFFFNYCQQFKEKHDQAFSVTFDQRLYNNYYLAHAPGQHLWAAEPRRVSAYC